MRVRTNLYGLMVAIAALIALLLFAQPGRANEANMSLNVANTGQAGATQDLQANIEKLVYNQVFEAVAKRYPKATFSVKPQVMANVTQLKHCARLSAQVRSTQLFARVPVYIRCEHPAPWSLYATAEVDVNVDVVVAQRAIARGERITRDMLTYQTVTLNQLRTHTLERIEDALGKEARRPLAALRPISLNALTTPPTISKGERVQISAKAGRVTIRSFGVALGTGQIGEQIQVRNEASQRIIRPWIIGPGQVATHAPRLAANHLWSGQANAE